MFLTHEELQDMTGYKRHAEIMKWLDKNGIFYRIAADGTPKVLRSVAMQAFSFKTIEPSRPRLVLS